jgi:hypothetical protein
MANRHLSFKTWVELIAGLLGIVAAILAIIGYFHPEQYHSIIQTIQGGDGVNVGSVDKSHVDIRIKK